MKHPLYYSLLLLLLIFISMIQTCTSNALFVNNEREFPIYMHKRRKTNKINSFT